MIDMLLFAGLGKVQLKKRYVIVCRFGEGAIKEESKGGRRKECSKKYI